jgi:hypothetical protein
VKTTDNGGPAFPEQNIMAYGNMMKAETTPGMTLRDWFAGQVLAGQWTLRESEAAHIEQPTATNMAASAYRIADAMLAARKRVRG